VEIKENQKQIIKCKNEKDKFEKNGCKEVQNISDLIQDIESKMHSMEKEYKEITLRLKSRNKEMKETFVKRKSVDERDPNGIHALLDEMKKKNWHAQCALKQQQFQYLVAQKVTLSAPSAYQTYQSHQDVQFVEKSLEEILSATDLLKHG